MRTLFITLKKQWFDMIKSGEKREEYREIRPYWTKRLFTGTSETDMDDFFIEAFEKDLLAGEILSYSLKKYRFSHIYYSVVRAINGRNNNSPTITWHHDAVGVGKPNPKWCEPGDVDKIVYVLYIGKIIN